MKLEADEVELLTPGDLDTSPETPISPPIEGTTQAITDFPATDSDDDSVSEPREAEVDFDYEEEPENEPENDNPKPFEATQLKAARKRLPFGPLERHARKQKVRATNGYVALLMKERHMKMILTSPQACVTHPIHLRERS